MWEGSYVLFYINVRSETHDGDDHDDVDVDDKAPSGRLNQLPQSLLLLLRPPSPTSFSYHHGWLTFISLTVVVVVVYSESKLSQLN